MFARPGQPEVCRLSVVGALRIPPSQIRRIRSWNRAWLVSVPNCGWDVNQAEPRIALAGGRARASPALDRFRPTLAVEHREIVLRDVGAPRLSRQIRERLQRRLAIAAEGCARTPSMATKCGFAPASSIDFRNSAAASENLFCSAYISPEM